MSKRMDESGMEEGETLEKLTRGHALSSKSGRCDMWGYQIRNSQPIGTDFIPVLGCDWTISPALAM